MRADPADLDLDRGRREADLLQHFLSGGADVIADFYLGHPAATLTNRVLNVRAVVIFKPAGQETINHADMVNQVLFDQGRERSVDAGNVHSPSLLDHPRVNLLNRQRNLGIAQNSQHLKPGHGDSEPIQAEPFEGAIREIALFSVKAVSCCWILHRFLLGPIRSTNRLRHSIRREKHSA